MQGLSRRASWRRGHCKRIKYQQIVDSKFPWAEHAQNKQGVLQALTTRQTVNGIRQPRLVFDDQALQG